MSRKRSFSSGYIRFRPVYVHTLLSHSRFGPYVASDVVLGSAVACPLGRFELPNTPGEAVASAFLSPIRISLLVPAHQEVWLKAQGRFPEPCK